ncbi:MAG: serine/threonine-protein kinase [Bryobacterales bacterium]
MTESIDILLQLLEALQHAHTADVIHREISPSNVFLSAGGHVKLSGFTLARQSNDPKLTAPGLVNGPVHYLSPEQVKGLSDVDGRADVYSAGVLLYEMITGSKPFDSRSQFDIMQAHVMSTPPEPSDLREDVPPEVSAVILKALEKFPDDRYRSAEEFREALTRVRKKALEIESQERAFNIRPPMENLDDDLGKESSGAHLPLVQRRSSPRARAAMATVRGPLSGPDWGEIEGDDDEIPMDQLQPAPAGAPGAGAHSQAWKTRDLLTVGFLTFLMVGAAVVAVLFLLEG